MSSAYQYKPRFVDIRIKPPPPKEAKPEERACDWPECRAPGSCRAPKGADRLKDYYVFCPSHAAEYNANWDFFANMSEEEVAAHHRMDATGHRPTWGMGTHARVREAAGRAKRDWSRVFVDGFGLFGGRDEREPEPRERKLGKLEITAYDTLGLEHDSSAETVRARYAELLKRYHPDANGGDRSTENRLQLVIRAYKTLKKTGLA